MSEATISRLLEARKALLDSERKERAAKKVAPPVETDAFAEGAAPNAVASKQTGMHRRITERLDCACQAFRNRMHHDTLLRKKFCPG